MFRLRRLIIVGITFLVFILPVAIHASQGPAEPASNCAMERHARATLHADGQPWSASPVDRCLGTACAAESYQRAQLQVNSQVWGAFDDIRSSSGCASAQDGTPALAPPRGIRLGDPQ